MYKKFNQNKPKDKDIIITIKRLGINGEGIGYYRKKIIFIPGALPAEVVVAKIIKEYPRYIDAELVRIKEKSPNRVSFPAKVNPAIGGLELAHLAYPKQLEFKRDNVLEALKKFHPRGYSKYKVKKPFRLQKNGIIVIKRNTKLNNLMVKSVWVFLPLTRMNCLIYQLCQRKARPPRILNAKSKA